jgi:hypothetical protein
MEDTNNDQEKKEYLQSLKQDSEEWLEARRKYSLTASEFAAACGLSKSSSAQKLLDTKINEKLYSVALNGWEKEKIDPFVQEIMNWGKDNESIAFNIADDILSEFWVCKTGLWEISGTTFAASPDGVLYKEVSVGRGEKGKIIKPCGILEIKCPYTQNIYSEVMANGIPVAHFIQMIGQMIAVGVKIGYYVCWTPDITTMNIIDFSKDDELDILWDQIEKWLDDFIRHIDMRVKIRIQNKKYRKEFIEKYSSNCPIIYVASGKKTVSNLL